MSFVDTAKISLKAGKGGDGMVHFRHEKFIDKGGPDGGDGGDGGDIVFVASNNQNTLAKFRHEKQLKAADGSPGDKQKKHGKNGQNLTLKVPVGTVFISDESGAIIADLTASGQQIVIASGGQGGFGNAHFISSTRQAPKVAEKGEAGQQLVVSLELKLIADVGLVGLPNAGKSTLLSVLTNSRPRIADYPFTTLEPNLGVVDIDDSHSLLLADIPGLIEGAASGKGLGDEFLRHVERTKVLVHLIDAYQANIAEAYQTIQKELKNYRLDLSSRPQIVAINKTEGLGLKEIKELKAKLSKLAGKKTPILTISGQAKQGLSQLLRELDSQVAAERAKQQTENSEPESEDLPIIKLKASDDSWAVETIDGQFLVTGAKIERFAAKTDFSSREGLGRLRDIMQKSGITHELARRGAQPGAEIAIAQTGKIIY
ncbi:MAG: GTPase ObgE [Candidatus Saccharimonadales bacterium]